MRIHTNMDIWSLAELMGPDATYDDAVAMRAVLCASHWTDTDDIPENDEWLQLIDNAVNQE